MIIIKRISHFSEYSLNKFCQFPSRPEYIMMTENNNIIIKVVLRSKLNNYIAKYSYLSKYKVSFCILFTILSRKKIKSILWEEAYDIVIVLLLFWKKIRTRATRLREPADVSKSYERDVSLLHKSFLWSFFGRE